MAAEPASARWVGLGFGFAAVLIWSAWFSATAHGVRGALDAVDVTLIRVVVPTLLLAPILYRARARLIALRWYQLVGIGLYGIPFVLALATGLRFAPVSHAAALVPGLMPVLAGVLGVLLLGERLTAWRIGGFALMLAAAAMIALEAGMLTAAPSSAAVGHVFFLLGCAAWAGFTLTTRLVGLDPFVATGLVGLLSTVILLPLHVGLGLGRLGDAPWSEIVFQILAQGVFAGLVAVYAYARAIRLLGVAPAAALAALVPGLATLISWAVLGERPTALEAAAMVVVAVGVYLASGVRLKPRDTGESARIPVGRSGA